MLSGTQEALIERDKRIALLEGLLGEVGTALMFAKCNTDLRATFRDIDRVLELIRKALEVDDG